MIDSGYSYENDPRIKRKVNFRPSVISECEVRKPSRFMRKKKFTGKTALELSNNYTGSNRQEV